MNKAIIAIFALLCVLSNAAPSMMRPQRSVPIGKFQDHNLDALNFGVNAGNNGYGANAGYQRDFKNGNWNVGGQIQTNPGGRPNWGVNAGLTMKFDDDNFAVEDFQDNNLDAFNMGVNAGNNGFGANAGYQRDFRNGNMNVGGQIQTNPGGRPNWNVNAGVTMKWDDEAQDNNLAAFEEFQDNNLDAFNMGVNAGNNGFGANAGYQKDFRNGNMNFGGKIQTNPGGRPDWNVNAGMTMKWDDENDDNFALEDFQDNNLDAFNMGVNAGNNGFGANAGYQRDFRNGNMNVGGQIQTNPGGRPNWNVNAGVTMKWDDENDDVFALEDFQDNNLDALNFGVNAGNRGYGANAGYQRDFKNGNWNVGGQIQTNPGGRPNWGVNAGLTMKFDEEQ